MSSSECWGEVSGELVRVGRSKTGSLCGLPRRADKDGEEKGSESSSCSCGGLGIDSCERLPSEKSRCE